jgi:hypothetical protein
MEKNIEVHKAAMQYKSIGVLPVLDALVAASERLPNHHLAAQKSSAVAAVPRTPAERW